MKITGKAKQDILADIFGRQSGEVFERGLYDADSAEHFQSQMAVLKTRWTSSHQNGSVFYEWFNKNKSAKFVDHLISPVRQRAGLGCPPSRFTTNRSERTNGVIQDYVKRKCGQQLVDVFTFSVKLKELVDMQEKEVELAVVNKGEYVLHPAYRELHVTASQWAQMTYDQQQAAVKKVHLCNVEDVSRTEVTSVAEAVSEVTNPILKVILDSGVDWIPRDTLMFLAEKAAKLESERTVVELPSTGTTETVVVPSKSNPKKPHVVNIYPNGKCECDNCHAYASSFICAHVIAASLKKSKFAHFLRWLVTSKRKTGGVNYSEAISFGMPKGRGRKGEEPPRKRKRKPTNAKVVQRVQMVPANGPQHQPGILRQAAPRIIQEPPQLTQATPQFAPPQQNATPQFSPPQQNVFPQQMGYNNTVPQVHQQLTAHACRPTSAEVTPPYPSPAPNTFLLYSLHFCPPLTSVCFGCGNPLKQAGVISDPPGELVIVSNMQRQWIQGGQWSTKPGNVYFHCSIPCVRRRQPDFVPQAHCTIPDGIKSYLTPMHRQYIMVNLGIAL